MLLSRPAVMTGSATPDNSKEAEQVGDKAEAAATTSEGPSGSSQEV